MGQFTDSIVYKNSNTFGKTKDAKLSWQTPSQEHKVPGSFLDPEFNSVNQ